MEGHPGEPGLPKPPEYIPLRRVRWNTGGAASGASMLFGHSSWLALLGLAFRYGWRPKGTKEPEHWNFNPWSRTRAAWTGGDYFSPLGQRVGDEDAREIAEALAKALPDIPAHDALGGKSGWTLDLPNAPPVHWVEPGQQMNALEYFSGARRKVLEEFVSNCQTGGFTIS